MKSWLKLVLVASTSALIAACGSDDDDPAPGTVAEVATEAGFGALVAAADKAGLVGALSDPNATLTVFAPSDAAFTALATSLGFASATEMVNALDGPVKEIRGRGGKSRAIVFIADKFEWIDLNARDSSGSIGHRLPSRPAGGLREEPSEEESLVAVKSNPSFDHLRGEGNKGLCNDPWPGPKKEIKRDRTADDSPLKGETKEPTSTTFEDGEDAGARASLKRAHRDLRLRRRTTLRLQRRRS